jgi:hypothetical protein
MFQLHLAPLRPSWPNRFLIIDHIWAAGIGLGGGLRTHYNLLNLKPAQHSLSHLNIFYKILKPKSHLSLNKVQLRTISKGKSQTAR